MGWKRLGPQNDSIRMTPSHEFSRPPAPPRSSPPRVPAGWGARRRGPARALLAVLSIALAALAPGCASGREKAPEPARIVAVTPSGAPIQGAILLPEVENERNAPPLLSPEDIRERTSDARGQFHVDLESYFWSSDGCFHFRVIGGGFETVTMAVSRDLFPPVLRIEMKRNDPRD